MSPCRRGLLVAVGFENRLASLLVSIRVGVAVLVPWDGDTLAFRSAAHEPFLRLGSADAFAVRGLLRSSHV